MISRSPGFKTSYTWKDLRPVLPVVVTALAFQAVGMFAGYSLELGPDWYASAWLGGALATFPGFLLGLPVQAKLRPGTLALHRSMLATIGAIALFLFVVALAFPEVASGAP